MPVRSEFFYENYNILQVILSTLNFSNKKFRREPVSIEVGDFSHKKFSLKMPLIKQALGFFTSEKDRTSPYNMIHPL